MAAMLTQKAPPPDHQLAALAGFQPGHSNFAARCLSRQYTVPFKIWRHTGTGQYATCPTATGSCRRGGTAPASMRWRRRRRTGSTPMSSRGCSRSSRWSTRRADGMSSSPARRGTASPPGRQHWRTGGGSRAAIWSLRAFTPDFLVISPLGTRMRAP